MNNKGQTLVVFVILIPVLLLLLISIFDLGLLYIEKRNISNNLYDAVEYYINNSDKEDIDQRVTLLIQKNIKDCKIDIERKNNLVEIKINKKLKKRIINQDSILLKYVGIFDTKEIKKG